MDDGPQRVLLTAASILEWVYQNGHQPKTDRRISGPFARPSGLLDVDIEGLVRRLLLFDKYVLASQKLEEFPP